MLKHSNHSDTQHNIFKFFKRYRLSFVGDTYNIKKFQWKDGNFKVWICAAIKSVVCFLKTTGYSVL